MAEQVKVLSTVLRIRTLIFIFLFSFLVCLFFWGGGVFFFLEQKPGVWEKRPGAFTVLPRTMYEALSDHAWKIGLA
jgi:hypothetical protein